MQNLQLSDQTLDINNSIHMEQALSLVYVVITDLSQHQMDYQSAYKCRSVFSIVETVHDSKECSKEETEHVIPANLPAT